jgi:DNA polymerase-3 subunit epsilon
MLILPFDTETSGIPDWQARSNDPCQPHIVQLAALLVDQDTKQVQEFMDVIVKPDGWEITKETSDIHGITMERAMDEGIAEEAALDMFLTLYKRADIRIAHNTTFDNRIIRIALKRYMPDRISDDEWKDKARYYCTMIHARKIMQGKQPKLSEAYLHFMGREMEGAHSAMPDTHACMDIYFAMQD